MWSFRNLVLCRVFLHSQSEGGMKWVSEKVDMPQLNSHAFFRWGETDHGTKAPLSGRCPAKCILTVSTSRETKHTWDYFVSKQGKQNNKPEMIVIRPPTDPILLQSCYTSGATTKWSWQKMERVHHWGGEDQKISLPSVPFRSFLHDLQIWKCSPDSVQLLHFKIINLSGAFPVNLFSSLHCLVSRIAAHSF